jgi:hypothetical protein
MFESRNTPLLPRRAFLLRLAGSAAVGLSFLAVSLFAGMLGYHGFEKMPWLDAYANAAMILSGMGPLAPPQHPGGKVFAGLYALFSGFAVILISAILFAPVVHRALHRFHLESSKSKGDDDP